MVSGIVCFDSSPSRWVPGAFAVAALVLPFVAYIAAIYHAPLFAKWPRTLKAGVLTVLSIVVTIGGYLVFFTAGFLLKGAL